MGQYYKIVNLDKREYLDPHNLGDGLKLLEFGCSANGTLTALSILLADGNGRGGGDLHSDHPIIGAWAGDRIVIAGDYADEGRFVPDEYNVPDEDGNLPTLYRVADEQFKDVSFDALEALFDDPYIRRETAAQVRQYPYMRERFQQQAPHLLKKLGV